MQKKLFTLIASSILLISFAHGEISTVADAINKVGKQRMLSQKMMKSYSMVGMSMKFGKPKVQLEQSVTLFSNTLDELISFTKDKPSLDVLNKVKEIWTPIQGDLKSAPDKTKALSLFASLDTLLEASHTATDTITKASGANIGEIINISGKQRMLSQRLGSIYMLKVWKVGIDDKLLSDTIAEFEKAHAKLIAFPKNSDEINKILARVKKDFMFFEILGASKSKKYIPSIIARTSDKITKKMNKVTQLYVNIK